MSENRSKIKTSQGGLVQTIMPTQVSLNTSTDTKTKYKKKFSLFFRPIKALKASEKKICKKNKDETGKVNIKADNSKDAGNLNSTSVIKPDTMAGIDSVKTKPTQVISSYRVFNHSGSNIIFHTPRGFRDPHRYDNKNVPAVVLAARANYNPAKMYLPAPPEPCPICVPPMSLPFNVNRPKLKYCKFNNFYANDPFCKQFRGGLEGLIYRNRYKTLSWCHLLNLPRSTGCIELWSHPRDDILEILIGSSPHRNLTHNLVLETANSISAAVAQTIKSDDDYECARGHTYNEMKQAAARQKAQGNSSYSMLKYLIPPPTPKNFDELPYNYIFHARKHGENQPRRRREIISYTPTLEKSCCWSLSSRCSDTDDGDSYYQDAKEVSTVDSSTLEASSISSRNSVTRLSVSPPFSYMNAKEVLLQTN